MKRIFLLCLLLTACSNNDLNQRFDIPSNNFSQDLSLEEFRVKLTEYANKSSYPNIDN